MSKAEEMYLYGINLIVPVAILIVMYFVRRNPPSGINAIYGYRTPKSMKNDDTFLEAFHYSNKLLFQLAFIYFNFELLLIILSNFSFFKPILHYTQYTMYSFIWIILFIVIVMTEYHLGKTFDKDGNRKQKV